MSEEELRYMLFSGPTYYPDGGFCDYRGSYSTVEEAAAAIKVRTHSRMVDWFHIVDKDTMRIVTEWRDTSEGNGGF